MQLTSDEVPRCPSNLVGAPSSVQLPSAGAPVPPKSLPPSIDGDLSALWNVHVCFSSLTTRASDIKGLG